MNLKKILSYAAFFFGLAILVACMFIWGGEKNNVFYLNLSVFVVAYCMFFGPLLMGHSQSADDENKIGSWGLKWLVLTLYPIAAVAAVFLMVSLAFAIQLMVHLGLLLLLLLSFVAITAITSKVRSINSEQKAARAGVQLMKRAMAAIQDKLVECPDVPANYKHKLDEIEQALRFISPSDSPEAAEFEDRFVETATEIKIGLPAFHMNKERMETAVIRLDRLINQRKNTYSN